MTGLYFSMIFSNTGRLTKIILTSTSSATAYTGMQPLARAIPVGGASPSLHARTAKSVFHFDVPGAVAKSTHAGLPWLRYLRQHLGSRVHFWPFDGWQFPPNTSVIAEVYPALWNKGFPSEGRTADQQDAFAIAEWLRRADIAGTLSDFLCPVLAPADREIAKIEGWILGIVPVLPWAALNASTRIQ
ncbi:MAG: hypothetical protein ACXVIO_04790 [Candidatus Angelobacter sp.]